MAFNKPFKPRTGRRSIVASDVPDGDAWLRSLASDSGSPIKAMNTWSDGPQAKIDPDTGYISNIDQIREAEYPMLRDTVYLDHTGTTIYAKSLIESFSKSMISNLLGNPHSASASSQLSTQIVDRTRLDVLRFFNANPEDFDIIFTANASTAIKLVADAFRDVEGGFGYRYHIDTHNSVVGIREYASLGARRFSDFEEIKEWIAHDPARYGNRQFPKLVAYPGQSNMNGYRPPLQWCKELRRYSTNHVYTLLDVAALVSTSPLDLSDASSAPDFIACSFYKIFGFPDLGALLVRKSSGGILDRRVYFAGGTVDMVTTYDSVYHEKREGDLHNRHEDGTLPFHSILALSLAIPIHLRIWGSMHNISRHTAFLARKAVDHMLRLRHSNGRQVCMIYGDRFTRPGQTWNYGPVIAFNLLDSNGKWLGKTEVERLAGLKGIQVRTGGMCNPGGIGHHLELSSRQMRRNYQAGQRCGDDHDVMDGKPTGIVRVSIGAMNNLKDVETFLAFIEEFFVEHRVQRFGFLDLPCLPDQISTPAFLVESLSIFPIKSCGAFRIPHNIKWEVKSSGLAFDREWCLVHTVTGAALSQKQHPLMALLRPKLDLEKGTLEVSFASNVGDLKTLKIELGDRQNRHEVVSLCDRPTQRQSKVCGEKVDLQIYESETASEFFTQALGIPCTLARCPPRGTIRVGRPRLQKGFERTSEALTFQPRQNSTATDKSILLSNESPILLVSRSSVNRLNESIKASGSKGRAVSADEFRANIVIAQDLPLGSVESPYEEETWRSLSIGSGSTINFDVIGPCQRCQMVCINQKTAQRSQEPFVTLAKTRRKEGKIWFGIHISLTAGFDLTHDSDGKVWIQEGDRVKAS